MRRTRRRPLPAGRIKRRHALAFGLLLSAAGFAELWYGTNLLAAALGTVHASSYLLLYTPLKQRSPVCTTVGAIPARCRPSSATRQRAMASTLGAMALFLILFVWQFPHFDAIAWMYRDDYARGGIRMLPVIDPDGESTARRVVVCSLLLIPISLVPLFLGMTGDAVRCRCDRRRIGIALFGARLGRERTLARAHALLLATVFYLPALLGVMVLDRRVL